MKVEATQPFTAFTGEMVVFNTGDVRELPDAVAGQYIDAGMAKKAAKKADITPTDDAAPVGQPEPEPEAPASEEPPAPEDAPPA